MGAFSDGPHHGRESSHLAATATARDSAETQISRRSVIALLNGIKSHAVVADPQDAERFQQQLAEVIQRFGGPDDPAALVSEAIDIVRDYGACANRRIESQKRETAKWSENLSGTMGAIIASRPISKAVTALGKEIELAIDAGELRGSRTERFKQVLSQIQKELLNVRTRLTKVLSQARTHSEPAQLNRTNQAGFAGQVIQAKTGSTADSSQVDSLTGIPGRAQAEAELAKAYELAQQCHIALFAVKRLDLINAKFGYLRGDQVLLKVVQHLAEAVPHSEGLFRWTPCSFLLIVHGASYDELRRSVQAILLHRITPMLEWEGRSALVPITLEGHVQSVRDSPSFDSLREALDIFVL